MVEKSDSYDKLIEGVNLILQGLEVDADAAEFKETPRRVAKSLLEMTEGMWFDPSNPVMAGLFEDADHEERPTSSSVKVNDIRARGICPHHLLPVLITAEVTYKPNSKFLGLSKVHRLVRILARRPVLQERLTEDIAVSMENLLQCPVRVKLSAIHMCMASRGVMSDFDSRVETEIERGDWNG